MKTKNGGNHTQARTATLFRHFNEQGYIQVFHDNNRDFKSRTLFGGGDRYPVALFKSYVERRPLLNHPCNGLFFFFYLSSKRNRKFKHLVQTKPMGKDIITNIMKVSVAGTSLKKVRKKFRNRRARKTTVSNLNTRKSTSRRILTGILSKNFENSNLRQI